VRATTAHLDVSLHTIVSSGPDFRIARSLNRGMREATETGAESIVLLNDDAFMDAGWLDAFLAAMRAHPEVGVWGALLRYEDGRIQHAGAHIPLSPWEFIRAATRHRAPLWALRNIARQRFSWYPYMFEHYRTYDARHRLDFVTGAAALITRACYDKIGGYDEDYLFGTEDADHSLRALEAGFELGMVRRATGIHLDRGSGPAMAPRAKESEAIFRRKWSAARIASATRRTGRRGVYR
jgi:GT2 family glycosyltransferase